MVTWEEREGKRLDITVRAADEPSRGFTGCVLAYADQLPGLDPT